MPLHFMPEILKMVLIHQQAKEVDQNHLQSLKQEVIKHLSTGPLDIYLLIVCSSSREYVQLQVERLVSILGWVNINLDFRNW